MKPKFSKLVFILIFVNFTIAFATITDFKKAKLLFNEQKYREVLEIVYPCLISNEVLPLGELEECLYIGEIAAKRLEDDMLSAGTSDYERDEIFKRIGLTPTYDHYNGPMYNHDYYRKLKILFPKSKYKDKFSYILIERDVDNYPNGWKTWEKELIEYLKEFPNGHYSTQVKLDLAHMYDSLWAVLCCDELYGNDFSTGDKKKDLEIAELYRSKAIKLYDEVIKEAKINMDAISSHDREETKARILDLRARKHWNKTWIIND